MLYPLVSPSDVAAYEHSDAVADSFTYGAGMSCTDQLARAWGHADDYASDGMGAAASFYELDLTDLRLLAVASSVDAARARVYHHAPDRPYVASPDALRSRLRRDDRGSTWLVGRRGGRLRPLG